MAVAALRPPARAWPTRDARVDQLGLGRVVAELSVCAESGWYAAHPSKRAPLCSWEPSPPYTHLSFSCAAAAIQWRALPNWRNIMLTERWGRKLQVLEESST